MEQYRLGHKKLERKSGLYSGGGTHYSRSQDHYPHPHVRSRGLSGGGGPKKPRDQDVKRYIGASLVKAPKDVGQTVRDHSATDLAHLQKRALDLTGAPLIQYHNPHTITTHNEKEKVYRTQSLQEQHHDTAALQQLHQQMLFLRQLQAQHNQQMHAFPRYDVYDSGHGSLDGSSCGGSDHDLRAASTGSTEEPKRLLEAANSMPILTLLGHQADKVIDQEASHDAVEIELEDERKYLPTDLFIEHEKLCSTKSHNGKWENNRKAQSPNASGGAVRKTTSLNVHHEEDGFTLFSSDQLDLLSSVRSNWNKTSSSGGSSTSGGSDYGGDVAAAAVLSPMQASGSGGVGGDDIFEDAIKNLTQDMGTMILTKM